MESAKSFFTAMSAELPAAPSKKKVAIGAAVALVAGLAFAHHRYNLIALAKNKGLPAMKSGWQSAPSRAEVGGFLKTHSKKIIGGVAALAASYGFYKMIVKPYLIGRNV